MSCGRRRRGWVPNPLLLQPGAGALLCTVYAVCATVVQIFTLPTLHHSWTPYTTGSTLPHWLYAGFMRGQHLLDVGTMQTLASAFCKRSYGNIYSSHTSSLEAGIGRMASHLTHLHGHEVAGDQTKKYTWRASVKQTIVRPQRISVSTAICTKFCNIIVLPS